MVLPEQGAAIGQRFGTSPLHCLDTNEQPLPEGCSSLINADDQATTTQQHTFPEVGSLLERRPTDAVQTQGRPETAASTVKTGR